MYSILRILLFTVVLIVRRSLYHRRRSQPARNLPLPSRVWDDRLVYNLLPQLLLMTVSGRDLEVTG